MRDVTYSLTCEPEDMPIRGNASAWGTEEQPCTMCGGVGNFTPNAAELLGYSEACPTCDGSGRVTVDLDEAYAVEIEAHLDRGNDWAWCTVKVTARFEDFEGYAYLGGCSYEGPGDFIAHSPYYDDLKTEALADLWSDR